MGREEGGVEQQTGSKSGKEYVKAVYCHSAYLTCIQSTSCKMLGWLNHRQLGLSLWGGCIVLVFDLAAEARSPSPRAWRPDFPGAAREAP